MRKTGPNFTGNEASTSLAGCLKNMTWFHEETRQRKVWLVSYLKWTKSFLQTSISFHLKIVLAILTQPQIAFTNKLNRLLPELFKWHLATIQSEDSPTSCAHQNQLIVNFSSQKFKSLKKIPKKMIIFKECFYSLTLFSFSPFIKSLYWIFHTQEEEEKKSRLKKGNQKSSKLINAPRKAAKLKPESLWTKSRSQLGNDSFWFRNSIIELAFLTVQVER